MSKVPHKSWCYSIFSVSDCISPARKMLTASQTSAIAGGLVSRADGSRGDTRLNVTAPVLTVVLSDNNST